MVSFKYGYADIAGVEYFSNQKPVYDDRTGFYKSPKDAIVVQRGTIEKLTGKRISYLNGVIGL